MLDEIREQRLLVCHLRIEGVLIAGARALYGAGMARRGNRQLRPQPGVFLAKQGNLFGLLDHGGGWSGALGGGEGAARRWRGRGCSLGIIPVAAWASRFAATALATAHF